ncbi:hypothetical protein HTVC024P_gp58 [Pelagibacter phage HTVC024P]|nr:hypothetical protein HTVC024P_gp58 [Pelagibacter phage HTVC024P]
MPGHHGSSTNKRESYRTSHAFSSGNSGAKKTSTSFSGGGGNNNKETYRTTTQYTQYTPTQTKKAKAKVAADKKADDLKRLNQMQYEKPTGLAKFSPIKMGMYYSGIGKKTFEVNKSYFQKNVADQFINGKKSAYTNSPESFEKYMQDRGMGRVDAYGRTISNNDNGGGGSYVVEKNIGGKTLLTTTPTTAEVSQSKAAQVEDSIELKKRRVKAKGRSPTIMTGVTGATGGLTLGKPSLLGM